MATASPPPPTINGDRDREEPDSSPAQPAVPPAQRLPKWRRTMALWLAGALAIFIANTVFSVWAYVRAKNDDVLLPYNRNLYEGSCARARSLNSGLHLLINVLGTLLLGGANYCMQCLLSPTRREVDEAHAKRSWLDIGVVSVRNLGRISRLRAGLWSFLGLSSLSLHLFYNSTIYSSLANNDYNVISVNQAFGRFNNNSGDESVLFDVNNIQWNGFAKFSYIITNDLNYLMAGSFHTLDPLQCLDAYAQDFQSSKGNLYVVAADNGTSLNASEPAILYAHYIGNDLPAVDPYRWICSQLPHTDGHPCADHVSSFRANISDWRPFDHQIAYCLTEADPQKEQCKVQVELSLALIVTIVNLVEVVIMSIVVFKAGEPPLLTPGDAVLSFLEDPDPTTESMCLLEKSDVARFKPPGKTSHPEPQLRKWLSSPKHFVSARKRWHTAVGKSRWLSIAILYTSLMVVSIFFLAYGISHLPAPKYLASLWNLGLGTHPMTIINFPGWSELFWGTYGLYQTVMLANMAQPILSGLYILYNGMFTSMLQAAELNSYSVQRNGLRISTAAKGAQRGTYFLSLPYRYSVPLLVISALLHWLVSQSLFLVSIVDNTLMVDDSNTITGASVSSNFTCGYSPIAIIFVIIVAVLMATFAAFTGFKRFKSGMPVAGSCSAAISAACHPVPGLEKTVEADAPLQWGVMGVSAEGLAHCGFSSRQVEAPEDNVLYT